jgi:hypothetical protein
MNDFVQGHTTKAQEKNGNQFKQQGEAMKISGLTIAILIFLLTGCDSAETRAKKKAVHLTTLTCESSREGRSTKELQAIGDACFKRGSYTKSSGKKW